MQLCVIDDLITQYKAVINKYPDNAFKAQVLELMPC